MRPCDVLGSQLSVIGPVWRQLSEMFTTLSNEVQLVRSVCRHLGRLSPQNGP